MKKMLHVIMVFTIGISFQSIASDNFKEYEDINKKSNQLYGFLRKVYKDTAFMGEDNKNPNMRTIAFTLREDFPSKDNRIEEIVSRSNDQVQTMNQIISDAQSVRPVIHPKVLKTCQSFLNYKKEKGSAIEKSLYKLMSVDEFIYRLLYNRPLAFCNAFDTVVLRPHYAMKHYEKYSDEFEGLYTKQKSTTFFDFATIKYTNQLSDYLSYNEIHLAALLGMSSYTYFINNGNRFNMGKFDPSKQYEDRGIYVGLVGARLEKEDYMEWQEVIVTNDQNISANGYGRGQEKWLVTLWKDLYQLDFPTFDEVEAEIEKDRKSQNPNPRFVVLKTKNVLSNDCYFDIYAYKKRLEISIESFLYEANTRAKEAKKKARCFVVGLGLGVWQKDDRQTQWMVETYRNVIDSMDLPEIKGINFSYFTYKSPDEENQFFTPDMASAIFHNLQKNKHLEILFTKDNPADLPKENNIGTLLVAMYAWDGNAYAGNEYWTGMLTASGDPAAASCSTIAQIQNPLINRFVEINTKNKVREMERASNQQKIALTAMTQRNQLSQPVVPQQPTVPQPVVPQQNIQSNTSAQQPQPQNQGKQTKNLGPKKQFPSSKTPPVQPIPVAPSGPGVWEQLTSGLYSFFAMIKSFFLENYESY